MIWLLRKQRTREQGNEKAGTEGLRDQGRGDNGKGQVFCGAVVLLAPQLEKTAIAEGEVFCGIDSEMLSGAVDPLG